MKEQKHTFSKSMIPEGGVIITLSEGNTLQRVHLDMGVEGVTLAMVGAATATLAKGNRQTVTLKPGKEGISLAMVGAAHMMLRN